MVQSAYNQHAISTQPACNQHATSVQPACSVQPAWTFHQLESSIDSNQHTYHTSFFIIKKTISLCYGARSSLLGRRQNLNPEQKINLNHANLKPPNLWAVMSQEFARFTQESFALRDDLPCLVHKSTKETSFRETKTR